MVISQPARPENSLWALTVCIFTTPLVIYRTKIRCAYKSPCKRICAHTSGLPAKQVTKLWELMINPADSKPNSDAEGM